MIHRHKRFVPEKCECAREVDPDPECWFESRSAVTAMASIAGGSHSETNSKNASARPGSRDKIAAILSRISSGIACVSSCRSSASSSAASRIGTRFFACSRFASAGKTPPYSLCISTCERSVFPEHIEFCTLLVAVTLKYRNSSLIATRLNGEDVHDVQWHERVVAPRVELKTRLHSDVHYRHVCAPVRQHRSSHLHGGKL